MLAPVSSKNLEKFLPVISEVIRGAQGSPLFFGVEFKMLEAHSESLTISLGFLWVYESLRYFFKVGVHLIASYTATVIVDFLKFSKSLFS